MKLIKYAIGSLLLILFFCVWNFTLHAKPRSPYIEKNICPSECCQYGSWKAKSNLKIFKKEGDISAIAFTIKLGENFTAIRGNVHIVKLGILRVKKSFNVKNNSINAFSKGDKIYILSYRGEGYYDLWYKGKVLDIDTDQVWESCELVYLPRMIWWVLVENNKGNQGWLKIDIGDGMSEREEQIELLMDTCGKE